MMITWELINPSDPYTFEAPTVEVAAVTVAFLSTNFGARSVDGSELTPMLFGWDQWMKEHGIDDEWITRHINVVADALDSMLIGSFADRINAIKMLSQLAPHKRDAWKQKRQNRLRTSLNGIGERAYRMAKELRKAIKR